MSNGAFWYVGYVLDEQGPLTAEQVAAVLDQFEPEEISDVLTHAVSYGALTVTDGVYALPKASGEVAR